MSLAPSTSPLMEAEELRNILQHLGDITIHNHTENIVYSLFYGILIVLFWLLTRMLLQKGLNNRATCTIFLATLTGFLIATLVWAANVSISMIITGTYSNNNVNTTLEAKMEQSGAAAIVPEQAQFWSAILLLIVSDAVVIWRAWVLFPWKRWVMIGPLLLLLGTLGTAAGNLVVSTIFWSGGPVTPNLEFSTVVLSFATNLVSTLLIFWQLWTYRKFVRKNLGHRPSLAQNILAVLVESGTAYLTLQAINLMFNCLPSGEIGSAIDITGVAFSCIYVAMSGLYPIVTVILIHYKNAEKETYGISALVAGDEVIIRDVEARPATIGHLSFAVLPTVTGSNDSDDRERQAGVVEVEDRAE